MEELIQLCSRLSIVGT